MDLQLSKKRAIFLLGQALFIVLAISNLTAEASVTQQPSGRGQMLAPTITNGSFESSAPGNNKLSLSGWTVSAGNVDVLTGNKNKAGATIGASEGTNFLDIANGTIKQTVTGFTPNQPYILRIDYWGYHETGGFGTLAEATVLINGEEVRQGLFDYGPTGIRSKEEHDWVVCNGFQFTPTTSSVEIKIDSEETGNNGLLLDNIRIVEGTVAQPPVNTMTVSNNFWTLLENGGFQEAVANTAENTGPLDNPHVCGDAIPGWRVTRENADLVNGFGDKSGGDWVTDTGGHGPGSLAHTIGGLVPNASYTLEFEAGMHIFWGPGPMRGGFVSNGEYIQDIIRTSDQAVDDGATYPKEQIDLTSDENGQITFEIFASYVIEGGQQVYKGGNIAYDNFRLRKKQDPPQVTEPGSQSANNGDQISLTINASDPDGDDLTFSATNLPTGVSINEESGLISGTITTAGTYAAEVTVSDDARSTTIEFDWFVNALPSLNAVNNQQSNVGESISLIISATDPNDDPIEYVATGLPTGVSLNSNSGEIAGTLSANGTFSVTVTASDDKDGEDSISFAWNVNGLPVLQPVGDQMTPPGESVDLDFSAIDPDGDNLDFSSTGLPDGLSIDSGSGKVTGIVTKAGNYSVKVTVSDGNSGTDEVAFVWSVNSAPTLNSPGDQRTAEGVPVNLNITATDPENDGLTYDAINLPPSLSIESMSGDISGIATKTGTYAVTIIVADSNEGEDRINFNWEVYAKTPPTGEGDIVIFLPLITR